MLNILGSIHRIDGNCEYDKKCLRILKSQRRAIFLVMILVMIIDISNFITNEDNFWGGLFSGIVFVICIGGLFINFKLSRGIGTKI